MSGEREQQYDGVDALIDEAARTLTRSEPPVALRARVRSSIAAAHRGRSSAWQPVMAGAALVVIATAVMWRLPFTTEPVVPPSIPQRGQRSPAVPPTESQQTSREPAAGGPTERVARRRPETPTQTTSVVLTPAAEPLPEIEPIAIEPVPPSAIVAIERMPAPTPLSVDAIAIETLFE